MVKEIQILDVKGIELSEVFVSENNTWREISITTDQGVISIDLYASDQDANFLTMKL